MSKKKNIVVRAVFTSLVRPAHSVIKPLTPLTPLNLAIVSK